MADDVKTDEVVEEKEEKKEEKKFSRFMKGIKKEKTDDVITAEQPIPKDPAPKEPSKDMAGDEPGVKLAKPVNKSQSQKHSWVLQQKKPGARKYFRSR